MQFAIGRHDHWRTEEVIAGLKARVKRFEAMGEHRLAAMAQATLERIEHKLNTTQH